MIQITAKGKFAKDDLVEMLEKNEIKLTLPETEITVLLEMEHPDDIGWITFVFDEIETTIGLEEHAIEKALDALGETCK